MITALIILGVIGIVCLLYWIFSSNKNKSSNSVESGGVIGGIIESVVDVISDVDIDL